MHKINNYGLISLTSTIFKGTVANMYVILTKHWNKYNVYNFTQHGFRDTIPMLPTY